MNALQTTDRHTSAIDGPLLPDPQRSSLMSHESQIPADSSSTDNRVASEGVDRRAFLGQSAAGIAMAGAVAGAASLLAPASRALGQAAAAAAPSADYTLPKLPYAYEAL